MTGFALGRSPATCALILSHIARDEEAAGHHGVAGRLRHVQEVLLEYADREAKPSEVETTMETNAAD